MVGGLEGVEGVADFFFVAVDGGAVEVAVAEECGVEDGIGNGGGRDGVGAERAEADDGDFGAGWEGVGGDGGRIDGIGGAVLERGDDGHGISCSVFKKSVHWLGV